MSGILVPQAPRGDDWDGYEKSMSDALYFEQLKVGDRWVSPSRTVTEQDVSDFAGLTGDFDPLHTDQEYAAKSPFGRRIAHGLLGLSLVAGLSSQHPSMNTCAFVSISDWRFENPIYFDDTVHVVTEVVNLDSTSGGRAGEVTWQRQLLNQDGQVLQQGQLRTLVNRKTRLRKPHMDRLRSSTSDISDLNV